MPRMELTSLVALVSGWNSSVGGGAWMRPMNRCLMLVLRQALSIACLSAESRPDLARRWSADDILACGDGLWTR
nr:hypothetical protein CFP56_72025 [Quercus suber]